MDNILELLNGSLGKEVVDGITRKTDASAEQTQAVVSTALPTLLGALKNNASSGDAQGILNALGSKHDGSILDNLSGFLGNDDTSDGNGILGHVLGNKRGAVEQAISGKTGVSSGTVSKIMAMLAPIVMGYLGKQSRTNNVSDGGGLSDMLGGMLGGQSGGGNILGGLLDQNGDGKLGVDDVGGLLGGLFGKK
ncbi:DUF937 domain-containing protein [Parapedobacter sp. 10938]|uniref:DUF937 domain-containing protein n=1 Tax=Parapedobacter flavus TaxID=3110225 RepID=UPI002DB58944|nr:DUF937 domain-containing protein [Parapedobacter sp. 10938]MEC3878468.1 DUF937 domain-containing protein [Parapedobacter sp. 10938]